MEPKETPKENQNIAIDKKSPPKAPARPSGGGHPLAGKILFIIIGILIAASVVATYWRIVVKRDYIVQAQTDCDPTTENCFIWQCDPQSNVEGEACTGDPESDIWYYKIIRRNAKNIPLCDPNDENCAALVCNPGEKDCSEELCTAENVKAPDTCNDPAQYNIDNPPEEDSEECAPDDEECLSAQEESAEECAPDDQECLDSQSSDTSSQ